MGRSPTATLCFGFYLTNVDSEDLEDDIKKDDICTESTGYGYEGRILFVPGTKSYTDWNQAIEPTNMETPSQEKIDAFLAAMEREGLEPQDQDEKSYWILSASYN